MPRKWTFSPFSNRALNVRNLQHRTFSLSQYQHSVNHHMRSNKAITDGKYEEKITWLNHSCTATQAIICNKNSPQSNPLHHLGASTRHDAPIWSSPVDLILTIFLIFGENIR
jgi:p-aminobenzoyl-glutamate transporter AbgT